MTRSLLKLILVIHFAIALCSCNNGAQFGLSSSETAFDKVIWYNNKVDLVMMVDNSGSMKDYQDRLILQVPSFVDRLNKIKMDYHIAVISSSVSNRYSGGQFLGSPSFLTNASANLVANLQSKIQIGENGSDLEAPFMNFKNIFFSDYVKYQGAGFLRPDALLVIITLSDDTDKSTISSTDFAKLLDSLRPTFRDGSRGWLYNYIGVLDLKSSCRSSTGGLPTVGLKHVELVDLSGGVKGSICESTLERTVGNIKARIEAILTDYKLESKPKVETIRVTLNGQQVPPDPNNGWTYNPTTNTVSFHGTAVPAADGRVLVTFDRADAN